MVSSAYLRSMKSKAPTFGTDVETRKGDNGSSYDFLWQAEQDARGLGESCAGIADGSFKVGGNAIELRGGA